MKAIVSRKKNWNSDEWVDQLLLPDVTITPKFVYVGKSYRFDRITGKKRNAFNPHVKPIVLKCVVNEKGAIVLSTTADGNMDNPGVIRALTI
jgi:hypothetical protein